MAFFLSNNIKLYIEDESTSTVHKLSIQSDFSYNRTANVNKINRNSMSPAGNRSVIPIIEEAGVVKFSFSTYAELDDTGVNVTSAQKLLWKGLLGSGNGITESPSGFSCQFGSTTDLPSLEPLVIYIQHITAAKITKLSNIAIDRVLINIDIDKLVNFTWYGTALEYEEELGALPSVDKDYTNLSSCLITKYSGVSLTRNLISYDLVLTGGRIEINNNNVYYSKKQFGKAQKVIGHYTGTREISGVLNFYFKSELNQSYDLFHTLMTDANTDTTTAYAYDLEQETNIQLILGDLSLEHVKITIPNAVLNLPRQNFKNILSLSIPFVAKESIGKEVVLTYSNILRFRVTSVGDFRGTTFGDNRVYVI